MNVTGQEPTITESTVTESTVTEPATTQTASAAAGSGPTVNDRPAPAPAGREAVPARRPGLRERTAFIFSALAVVVYLILVYFVFVRPGVQRVDHALAVALPAVVLGLCTELYPRMPAGLRAALALLFGTFGLVTGVVQGARLVVEGFSTSALCGLLPFVAGVVWLIAGVCVLWASRKRGGPLWWTVVRRVLIVVAALFVAYWIVLPVSMAILATERPNAPAAAADLGRPAEKVTIVTRDGITLSARYVPSRNRAAVVAYPGAWTGQQARLLAEQGYGVLLVDPRGYGDSEGDPNAYGWAASRDIDAAVLWLRRNTDVQRRRIGGLGLSVGGEAMIDAAAGNSDLGAVVSEGAGIRSVRESLLRRGPRALEKALQYPADLVQTFAVWILSGDEVPISLRNASLLVAPRAVFFIYGEDGQAIEKSVNPVYYDAAFQPKVIWQVPGAGHTGGLQAQPEEYERRIVDFFDRALLAE